MTVDHNWPGSPACRPPAIRAGVRSLTGAGPPRPQPPHHGIPPGVHPANEKPFEVFLSRGSANLPKDSKIKADQIRTLDKSRMIKNIGILDKKDLDALDKAIKIHLALP